MQEFSWVVLPIGKLHLEMNMARHFIDLNWDKFLSKLASELGFVSENSQKYMRLITLIALWKEMLIPYIRDRLASGSPDISVNDYPYKWIPEVGWNSATYKYIFGMTYNYLMALMVLRIVVRRNNSSYIRAWQLSFAPLFHRSSSSKYALIDLHDR